MAATDFATSVPTSFLPLTTQGTSVGPECASAIYQQANGGSYLGCKSIRISFTISTSVSMPHVVLIYRISSFPNAWNRGSVVGHGSRHRALDMLANAGNIMVESRQFGNDHNTGQILRLSVPISRSAYLVHRCPHNANILLSHQLHSLQR